MAVSGMRSDLDRLDMLYAPSSSKHQPPLRFAWSSLKSARSSVAVTFHVMAGGSKRSKVKKLLSPTRAVTPPPPEPHMDDDTLMDDLLAQLDDRDKGSKEEAATVLSEMNVQKTAEDAAATASAKQDSKSRHKARQVRTAEHPLSSPGVDSLRLG